MNEPFPYLSGGSGAAFLLDSPSTTSSTLSFPEGNVVVRKNASFATVALSASLSQEDAKKEAWRLLQDALDVLAANRQSTLQTTEGDCTYLVWIEDEDGYELVLVNTADMPWSVRAIASVGAAEPTAMSPAPGPLPRHAALRFYRLALTSNDLFDAYRNAYLALECLASEATPKGDSESELSWLKRALSGPLSSGIPPSLTEPDVIDDFYRGGRLPTFHAKVGSTFYAPHGAERQSMQHRFEKLEILLNRLLQHRFGSNLVVGAGSMSQSLYDAMASVSLTFDEIIFRDGGLRASAPVDVQPMSAPRRFNQLWGRATATRPASLLGIDALETRKGGVHWMSSELAERLPLHGVRKISIELNLIQYNSRSKRPAHPR